MLSGVNGNSLHSSVLGADRSLSKSIEKIASGKKINKASDDPAGSAMLSAMEAQSRGLVQMMANQQSQASVLQTASDSLSTTSSMLQSINNLSLQASNGTLTKSDRAMIQNQISQLMTQINMSSNQTQFNGQNLLDGTFNTTLPDGAAFSIPSMSADALGLSGISVETQGQAMNASALAQSAIGAVSSLQGSLGAALNGINSSISSLSSQYMNAISAGSQIGDVDMAQAIMDMTTAQIQSKASLSVFKMNDDTRSRVLDLLAD